MGNAIFQSYATVAQFGTFGLPAAAYQSATAAGGSTSTTITTQNISDQLAASSSYADAHLASQFVLPLKSWGTDLAMHVCAHAAYEMMTAIRGFNPDGNEDSHIVRRYTEAKEYFRQIAEQKITPNVVDSSPGGSSAAAPQVTSGLAGNVVGVGGASNGGGFYTGIPYQPSAYPYSVTNRGNRRGY